MKVTGSLTKLTAFAASLLITPALLIAAQGGQSAASPSKVTAQKSATPAAATAKDSVKWTNAYGNLPLAFEQNLGQTDPQVQFLSRGEGYEIFLTPEEAVLALRRASADGIADFDRSKGVPTRKVEQDSVIRLQLTGTNPSAEVEGFEKLETRTDYFTGNDPRNWHTDVPSYARVEYRDVYPGINLAYYGNHRRFEYDFIVSPGADANLIALKVSGADKLQLDSDGNLVLRVDGSGAEMQKPLVYQMIHGERREIAGNYVISGDNLTFAIGSYDATQPLVIDPVLNYSTYLGGSTTGDVAYGIAVDAAGDAYVTGQTSSATFPTTSRAYSTTLAASGSVFVSELNPTGTALLYSTYLSGDVGELGTGIALDPTPSANCLNGSTPGICIYVTGETFSTTFPTTANGYSIGVNAGNASGTAFISKINPAASGVNSLVYSSYLGGTNGDFGNGVAVDANSIAYVAGYTNSMPGAAPADFTVVGGYQSTLNSSNGNAFLAAVDTSKTGSASLVYSTYLGGSGAGAVLPYGDIATAVAVDSSKVAYFVGATSSPNFPTTSNAYVQTPVSFTNGTSQSVFVSKIDTTLTGSSSLKYSTYLAGAAPTGDVAWGVALGPANTTYVTGAASSATFPVKVAGTAGLYPSTPSATGVVFISVLDTTKSGAASLTYSELLGGDGGDSGLAIRVDAAGNAYIAGLSASQNFPLSAGAFQTRLLDPAEGNAFVAKINAQGSGTSADLLYSTYFGGTGANFSSPIPDRAYGIGLDSANNVYIAGQTGSAPSSALTGPYNNFPIFAVGGAPIQATIPASSAAAFVAKLTLIPVAVVAPTSLTFSSQIVGVKSATQTVTFTNNTNAALTIGAAPLIVAGTPAASATDFATTANTCTGNIAAGASCTVGVTFTASVTTTETATLAISETDSQNPAYTLNVPLSGTAVAQVLTVNVTPTTLTFSSQALNTASAAQTITVTNTGNVPVTFGATAIALSGTNAGDYSQTNTCNSAVLAPPPPTSSSSCTISVKFTPTAATNPRTATLTITDSATGSPQTVALSGTATSVTPDFSLTAPTSAVTVTAGSPASFTVNVVSLGGFTSAVTLTCTGTIPQGSCVAPASAVTPSATPGTAATFSVTTSAGMIAGPSSRRMPPVSPLQLMLFGLAASMLLMLPAARKTRTRFGLMGALAIFAVLAGCGGGNSSTTRTPAGSYTLTITGTSGATSHTATVTVTVQ